MLAMCTYPLRSLSPADITEVVSSHGAALIKKEGALRAVRRAGLADDDQELREKERRCTLITELTSELVFRLEIGPSGDLGLEWMTAGFSEASGYGPGDISTQGKLESIIHPASRAAFRGSLQKVLAGGQADTDIQYLTNSGELRWIRLHMVPEHHSGTRIIKGIIGRGKDITGRKKAEERI